jgi:hypothetical protein
MSRKFKFTPKCRPAHHRRRNTECRCEQLDFELKRPRQLSPQPTRAMSVDCRLRAETMLTSQPERGLAKPTLVSEEFPNSSTAAEPAPYGAGSERRLRAAQWMQEVEKWSRTRADPVRWRRPAGRRIPACRRRPVRRWCPADRGYPAGRWIAVVPARAPFRVMPVARVWPSRAIRPPVGRETARCCGGNRRRCDGRGD